MNLYTISDEIDTSEFKIGDVISPDILKRGIKFGLDAAADDIIAGTLKLVFPRAAVAVLAYQNKKDKAVTKITSKEQLLEYRNGLSYEWKKKTLYVEHPYRRKVLIEASIYKNFILREMVSDITNYIADNLDCKKIVVGLIDSKHLDGKAKVPVNEVNVDATIKCSLNSSYYLKLEDSHSKADNDIEYVWINQFPDVISAVSHLSGKMEVKNSVSVDLNVGANLKKFAGGSLGAKSNYEFYIYYEKA